MAARRNMFTIEEAIEFITDNDTLIRAEFSDSEDSLSGESESDDDFDPCMMELLRQSTQEPCLRESVLVLGENSNNPVEHTQDRCNNLNSEENIFEGTESEVERADDPDGRDTFFGTCRQNGEYNEHGRCHCTQVRSCSEQGEEHGGHVRGCGEDMRGHGGQRIGCDQRGGRAGQERDRGGQGRGKSGQGTGGAGQGRGRAGQGRGRGGQVVNNWVKFEGVQQNPNANQPFHEVPGPRRNINGLAQPINFSMLFMTQAIINMIVGQTNLYYRQCQAVHPSPQYWSDVTYHMKKCWLSMELLLEWV